jgi:hypothetical protein
MAKTKAAGKKIVPVKPHTRKKPGGGKTKVDRHRRSTPD